MHFGAFEGSGYERAVPIDSIGLACLFVVGVLCKPLVKFSLVVEKALFRVTPANANRCDQQGWEGSNFDFLG